MRAVFRTFTLIIAAVLSWQFAQAGLFDQSYFFSYIFKSFQNNAVYRQEKPFELPETLPEPAQLADSIAQHMDPQAFLCGASTSEHQCSKQCTPEICSWSRFAKQHALPQPTDEQYPMDWWKYYRSYIDYAKDTLKLNAIRFSIEWAVVQPNGPRFWNQQALDHYANLFIYSLKKGVTPLVCFHHYTDPCWFLDMGGFEKDQNVKYFASYCKKVYQEIMKAVQKDNDAVDALKEM